MSKNRKHVALTAEKACRFALGAYYRAAAGDSRDGPDLVGAWMLELSHKLRDDEVTGPHYIEMIDRWKREDNASSSEQFATTENRTHNGLTVGAR